MECTTQGSTGSTGVMLTIWSCFAFVRPKGARFFVNRETLDALRHLQACGLIVGSEGLGGLVCSTLKTVSSQE